MRKMNPDPKRKILVLLTMLFVLYLLPPVTCLAAGAITIDDKAERLTAAQEAQLRDKYSEITQYMNIAFVSRSFNSGSTAEFARSYVHLNYPVNPAVIFFIDMENRNLYIYANRAGLRTISRADARAITDNVYKYASRGQYYECVDNTFSQILTLCQGGRKKRPLFYLVFHKLCKVCL